MPGGQARLYANQASEWQTPFSPGCLPGPQLPLAVSTPEVAYPRPGVGMTAASRGETVKIIANAQAAAARARPID
jgi:hypothetical protein